MSVEYEILRGRICSRFALKRFGPSLPDMLGCRETAQTFPRDYEASIKTHTLSRCVTHVLFVLLVSGFWFWFGLVYLYLYPVFSLGLEVV